MSYSSDPILDANRHYDKHFAEVEEQDKRKKQLVQDLLQAVDKCEHLSQEQAWAPKRRGVQPVLGDILLDSLDYSTGPSFDDVFMVVIEAAKSGNENAKKLLQCMAETWAEYHVE